MTSIRFNSVVFRPRIFTALIFSISYFVNYRITSYPHVPPYACHPSSTGWWIPSLRNGPSAIGSGGDEDKRRDMIRVVEGNNYQRHYHIVHVHICPRVGGVVLETSDEPLCCVVLGKRTT